MRFLTPVTISLSIVACAQQPPTPGPTVQPVKCPGVTSADQQLRACVLSVGTHPKPPFNESRVEIDFTGPVIKRNFKLTGPDWIEVQVQGTASDPGDINTGHAEKRRLSTLH